jgi:UDP-glucuronate decarboxylase
MKVLITGGSGFIGSHLCQLLLEKNYQVICLDNFFTGQKNNIKKFLDHPGFTLIEQDVCDPFEFKVDQIYNLACPASPIHYQSQPIATTKTSVLGALNCLELSKKLGGIKILQASTSEIYGDPEVHPQKEDYFGNVNPVGPRSCYDEGKRCAETLFFDYQRQYQIPIRVVRIFNTYGPQMAVNDGRVVSNFIIQALNNEDITIYGDGSQTRSFCFVSDLIQGLYQMMEQNNFLGPVNLGNPSEFTIKELAEKVIILTGSQSKIIYQPLPQDDPKQRRPDITLANAKLSWQPKVDLQTGLQETIKYFKELV